MEHPVTRRPLRVYLHGRYIEESVQDRDPVKKGFLYCHHYFLHHRLIGHPGARITERAKKNEGNWYSKGAGFFCQKHHRSVYEGDLMDHADSWACRMPGGLGPDASMAPGVCLSYSADPRSIHPGHCHTRRIDSPVSDYTNH